MMRFEYKCNECQLVVGSNTRGDTLGWCGYALLPTDGSHFVTICNGELRRKFTVNLPRPIMEHFNMSLGRPVTGITDFREGMKVKAGEASERTGLDVKYAEISHEEARTGVTEEGMDATNRERVARGQKAIPS